MLMTLRSWIITRRPNMPRKRLAPVHPGEILAEEFLKPLALTEYRLAKGLRVPARRINEIVHGKRAISADTALRLGRFFRKCAALLAEPSKLLRLGGSSRPARLQTFPRCGGPAENRLKSPLLGQPKPIVPASISATVDIRACVSAEGTVTGIVVLQGPGLGFVEHLRECFHSATFAPATDAQGGAIAGGTGHFRVAFTRRR